MISTTRSLISAFGLVLALGSTGFAQEATAPATDAPAADAAPATDAPAADAAPAADGAAKPAAGADALSLGSEVTPPDGPGTVYTAATFDAWEQRCIRTADGADPCQMYQLLKDAQGTSVAEISIFTLPAGQQAVAGATIVAPLETLLTEQLTITVDGASPKSYPFSWCSRVGCIARVGFTQDEVDSFKKGAKATMTIVPLVAPDQKVNLDISLKGFTAAFEAVAKTPAP